MISSLPDAVLLILIGLPSRYHSIGGGVHGGDEQQGVAVVPGAVDEVLKGGADALLLHDVPHGLAPVSAPVRLVPDAPEPLADVAQVPHPVRLVMTLAGRQPP